MFCLHFSQSNYDWLKISRNTTELSAKKNIKNRPLIYSKDKNSLKSP